jgi:hypothetical protein
MGVISLKEIPFLGKSFTSLILSLISSTKLNLKCFVNTQVRYDFII